MIEARDLVKRYGSTMAVNDLSFSIRPGMVTGFLGPNGAGKPATGLWLSCPPRRYATLSRSCAHCWRSACAPNASTGPLSSVAVRQTPAFPRLRGGASHPEHEGCRWRDLA